MSRRVGDQPHSWPDSNGKILIGVSVLNILTWLLCTTFSAMILIKFNTANSLIKLNSLDLICPGIWGSLCYGLAGILGICAAYEKRQPLLVGTLVMAMLSIFSSLGIGTVSGAMAISPRFRAYNNPIWAGLEWTLFFFSLTGFIVNLSTFVLVAIVMCRPCCPRQKDQGKTTTASHNNSCIHAEGGLSLVPPPPPPGFFFNPPIQQQSQQTQQPPPPPQKHHQHRLSEGYASSPLPRVLVTSDTNL